MSDIFIHKSSYIEEGVQTGNGSKIWINSQIRVNSIIGSNCIISKDTFIDENVKIGDRCKIQNGVSVYQGVSIEDDVFVGPNVCFTNDKVPRAFNQEWKITKTLVKKGSSIGANATIICGVVIGEYSMIAAGSVVTKDVDPYTLVVGNPARPIAKINKKGERIDE